MASSSAPATLTGADVDADASVTKTTSKSKVTGLKSGLPAPSVKKRKSLHSITWPSAVESVVRPVKVSKVFGGTLKPVPGSGLSKTQWAAVITTRGATSVPPQNWRWNPSPAKNASL